MGQEALGRVFKGDNSNDFLFAFLHFKPLLKSLPREANAFLLERIPFQKGCETIFIELPPLNMYSCPLIAFVSSVDPDLPGNPQSNKGLHCSLIEWLKSNHYTTQRTPNVETTSIQRLYVESTLFQHCMHAGKRLV